MQKARRHGITPLRPLVGTWFQVLLHSSVRGSFHLSLTVLCAIGLSVVFSLSGWSPIIQPEFLVFRPTQVSTLDVYDAEYGTFTLSGLIFQSVPLSYTSPLVDPITPTLALLQRRFGLFPVRSPLLRESLLLSFPMGT